ncbi:DUF605-domain-containing protein [Saitoella complicata NRRL Y-17804]|uniref:Vta1 C-terminal domain-containing protein n=1 Tax=Saitoella complicata (strain BCRC 22490 / CBS 7301 / JCM 7358 / NBRC 10748 / NRRL Y-17804) TaxID=698492 RepID=A0A0E9NH78_SAICN|nr:DUF605-domain-containing protein [Saitoella complicata NRRL Y-17804]ODQ53003.1 DUF605-domain-containing protein [Saitoella complicata NRRL Y-17804]GAO49031.1 hypothetical protein G7K_3192-t1 [Saitoella complicata NRRL Y-17804]
MAAAPAMKTVTQFIKHSTELRTADPVVSYYCLEYAVQLSIPIVRATTDPEVRSYVFSLMDDVESFRAQLADNPTMSSKPTSRTHLLTFALRIFATADNEERVARASLKTATTFLAASRFLEVWRGCFLDTDEQAEAEGEDEVERARTLAAGRDCAEKIKYAKYQAARILRCVKTKMDPNVERRTELEEEQKQVEAEVEEMASAPPPPGIEPEDSSLDPFSDRTISPPIQGGGYYDNPPAPAPAPAPVASSYFPHVSPSAPERYDSPPDTELHAPSHPTPPAPVREEVRAKEVTEDEMQQARKHARFAISALEYEDVETAVAELRRGLAVLGAR